MWGLQLRLGWSAIDISDAQNPPRPRSSDLFVGDVSALYYPWGDTRWRPYILAGLGLANFDFVDDVGVRHDTTLLGLPFGFGVKYLHRRWLAWRAELLDNVAFGDNGLDSMNNLSLTVGVEVRWGATPRSYWLWYPHRHYW